MDSGLIRLSDAQMQRFLVDGYLVLQPELPDGFHGQVYDRLGTVFERGGNPFNNILPLVPELGRVFGHPQVAGALASILGDDYYLHMHRHCHDRAPGNAAQRLHKDSLHNSRFAVDGNRRHHHARWLMAFYYPQDTGEEMGPTAIVPRSQYLLDQQHEEDELHLTGPAGTVVIVHYDIWHRASGTVNVARNRYMVKFLFTRMSDPVQPSWRHEPGAGAPAWEQDGELPEVWDHQWRWHLGQSAAGAGSPGLADGRLAALFGKLAGEDERDAMQAAYRLGRSGAGAAQPLAAALRSSDDRVRRNAAYGFAPLGAAAVPALTDLAGDGDPAVRARAVDALGDVGPPARAGEAALTAALGDDEQVVREYAADALGLVCGGAGDASSAATALAAVMQDDNHTVRRNAALSLARIGSGAAGAADRVAGALAAGCDDASLYVNGYSVLGLRRLGTPRAHGELLARLEQARWEARETAPAGFRK
jgi:hypothetical protein